jgi:hypothetical protein
LYDYTKAFIEYLKKYDYLEKILLDDVFYKLFEEIIETEIL